MGEEQSQNPDQQGEQPRYNLEQKPEQDESVQSDAESAQATETTEPSSVDQNDDPDTRWDHDKAETMAAVLKEDGTFDDVVEFRDEVKQDVESKAYLDRNTAVEADNLRVSQEEVARDAEYTPEITQAYRKKTLEEDQAKYDTAVAETHALGERTIESSRQKVDKEIDEVLSSHQELYDINPAVFKEMRTEEFMGIAKELAGINSKIEENEADSKQIEWWSHQIKDAFEKKHIVSWNIVDALEKEIGMSLEMDDDIYDEMLKKFKAEVSDSFDKTPRQIMEGYVRVAAEYTTQFEAKKQADEQRKKEFLDKYKPETSDQDQN